MGKGAKQHPASTVVLPEQEGGQSMISSDQSGWNTHKGTLNISVSLLQTNFIGKKMPVQYFPSNARWFLRNDK